jgi:predicted Zn-dependent peptidase
MLTVLLFAQLAAASPPPTRFELSNGLRVWIQEDHSRPVALVHITYHAGSQNEGPGTTGVAHYVEHMVYRATENVRNEDVYGYIDRIGGRYTGGTWPEVTRYAETVPSWALESALRVTAERMTRAVFDSLEFERERSNVVTEAHGFADMEPPDALRDAVMMTAFELHPYRYSSNTWARDNLVLTRAQALAWYKEHYGPNNAVLVVVGDVKTDEARRLVEKHFGPLARAPGSGRIAVVEPPQVGEKRIWLNAPTDSARLDVVYRVPGSDHPDFPALVRFDEVFSARLRSAITAAHPGVRVETRHTTSAYPHVYRISAAGGHTVSMTSVLATVDRVIYDFYRRTDSVMAAPPPSPRMADSAAGATQSAVPPRRSSLTRVAEALAARESPPWEVSRNLRDSIAARASRVTPRLYTGFALTWIVPHRRTVGILQSGDPRPGHRPVRRIDVPAMSTPPARRMRPEPVPAASLEPLGALSFERAERTLSNGIRVRGARVSGSELLLRVLIDYGGTVDSLVRPIPIASADSSMRSALREVTAMLARRPAVRTDSSVEDRARARVMAAVLPPPINYADLAAPLSVALAGPQPAGQLAALAARHFEHLPQRRAFRPREAFTTVGPREELINAAGQRQVEIVAGLPGAHRNHADRRALELLNYIVGVPYYGGRLGWALTKTGLTYSSSAQSYFGEWGHILLSTTADTRNTPAVLQAIREVVAGVGESGVEQWELDEAKAFTLGRTILYGAREDSPVATIAAALTDSDAAGLELLDLPALSRAYLSVTLDDINRVARKYYRPDQLKVVAMGAIPSDDMKSPFAPGTFRALFEPK